MSSIEGDERRRRGGAGARAHCRRSCATAGHEVDLSFNTVGALQAIASSAARRPTSSSCPCRRSRRWRRGRHGSGSRTDLGRATCGVAVRDGMLMPDISTAEAFKRALRNSRSAIGANDPAHGGSSGIYLAELLQALGMAEELKPKMVLGKTGRECRDAGRDGPRPSSASPSPANSSRSRARAWSGRCPRRWNTSTAMPARLPPGRRRRPALSWFPGRARIRGLLQALRLGVSALDVI